MQTTIIILLTLPVILLAGWEETDYGHISEDELRGAKRFIPEENAVVIESAFSVKKFDLESGEIIKEVAIDNPDTSAVLSTNDLNNIFLITDEQFSNYVAITIKDYFKDEIVRKDTHEITNWRNYVTRYYSYYKLLNDEIITTAIIYYYTYDVDGKGYYTFKYDINNNFEINSFPKFTSYKQLNPIANIFSAQSITYYKDYNPIRYFYSTGVYIFDLDSGERKNIYYSKQSEEISSVISNYSKEYLFKKENQCYIDNIYKDNKRPIHADMIIDNRVLFSMDDQYLVGFNGNKEDLFYFIYQIESGKIIHKEKVSNELHNKNMIYLNNNYLYLDGEYKLSRFALSYFNKENLQANLISDTTEIIQNTEIQFYDISKGSPTKWNWDFGDGRTSNERNPVYNYKVAGTYDVKLVVENDIGLKDTIVKEDYIKVKNYLKPQFSISKISDSPLEIKFNNLTIGDVEKYVWNFGDGAISYEESPTHTFDEGTFDVTLTVFTEGGDYDQEIKLDLIKNGENNKSYELNEYDRFIEKELPTENNLIDVEFFDENSGIIVSDSGEVFYTNDGAENWEEADIPVDFLPSRIRYLSNGEAVIAGTNKTVLKTYDYGRNWIELSYQNHGRNILDFDCKSPKECIFSSQDNRIYTYTFNNNTFYEKIFEYEHINIYNGPDPNVSKNTIHYIDSEFDKYTMIGEPVYDYTLENIDRHYYFPGIYISDGNKTKQLIPFTDTLREYFTVTHPLKDVFVFGFNNNYITIMNGGGQYEEIEEHFVLSLNSSFNELFNFGNNIIIPDNNGNLNILEITFDTSYSDIDYGIKVKNSALITTDTLFDYHQITETKGIAVGSNGKYYITEFKPTNVEEVHESPELEVYPNPAEDQINLQFNSNQFVNSIELIDINGKVVKRELLKSFINNYEIKTNELAKGIYFLKISTQNGVVSRKIVIL